MSDTTDEGTITIDRMIYDNMVMALADGDPQIRAWVLSQCVVRGYPVVGFPRKWMDEMNVLAAERVAALGDEDEL